MVPQWSNLNKPTGADAMNKPKQPTTKPAKPSKKPAPSQKPAQPDEREYHLTRRDAAAGAPADESVTGEEDPGAGLEFLVDKPRH